MGRVPQRATRSRTSGPGETTSGSPRPNCCRQWRHRKAKDITRRDVREMLDAIVDRKAPIMANRTLALARKVFNFGLERDLVESNPCHKIKPPSREQSRERVLTDERDLIDLEGA